MTKTEKAVQIVLWCLVVLLGGYLAAKGLMKLREEPTRMEKNLMERAYNMVGKEIYYWTFPGRKGSCPVVNCFQEEDSPQQVVEDEETCDEIIQKYGDTISERIYGENQQQPPRESQLDQTEPQPGQTEPQPDPAGETPGRELPAWAYVTESSPAKDLSMEKLKDPDYLVRNFFVVDPDTVVDKEMMNGQAFLENNMALEPGGEKPQILIYHTHSQEAFADSVPGDVDMTVVGVGDYLESILTDVFGYQVIHLKDTFDLVDGVLDRSKAYNYALPVVEKVLQENPSLQVVIDLHRDGVPEDKHLVTEINGKPTAQIMLFNGMSRTVNSGKLESMPNPYLQENLSFAFQLSYQAAKYYPRFTRCIYLKGYRYNLHVRPRSILLEVGAQTNTVEEVKNAMEPFSVILNKVLKGE